MAGFLKASCRGKLSGHKTRSVFDRYNIIDEKDRLAAAERVQSFLKEQKKAAMRVVPLK